ncbi:MAG: hypothetical protein GEU80_12015 [Dehalococcoidia bacterium]|nr:hypothetical protein [Dehalococcoidia bacterium]
MPGVLAELLDAALVTVAGSVRSVDGGVEVTRATPRVPEVVRASLPAVVSVSNEIGQPRNPSSRGMMLARRAPVGRKEAAELLGDTPGDALELLGLEVPDVQGHCEMIDGDSATEKPAGSWSGLKKGSCMSEPVLVLLTTVADDTLRDADREALGAGRAYADASGGDLDGGVIGSATEGPVAECGGRGADLVLVTEHDRFARFSGDLVVAIASQAARPVEARTIVVPRGPDTLELLPRLAARLGGACHGTAEGGQGPPRSGGGVRGCRPRSLPVQGRRALVAAMAAAAADPPPLVPGRTADRIALELPHVVERIELVEPAVEQTGPRLEDARIVVSGGRGLRDAENYGLVHELATALGGMPRASRATDLLEPASFVDVPNQEDLEAMIPAGHRDFVAGLMRDHNIPKPKENGRRGRGTGDANLLRRAREQLAVIFEEKVPIFAWPRTHASFS